jgi:hypothetical protein
MTREDIFFEMYKEQITHVRHTEVQRLEVTKFLVGLAAALVGVMGALKFSIHCLPLCATLVYCGFLGRRLTGTYVHRLDGHTNRAREFRRLLDSEASKGEVEKILSSNPVVRSSRLRSFWLRVNTAIIILGVLCSCWNLGAIGTRLHNQSGSTLEKLENQLAFSETTQPQSNK